MKTVQLLQQAISIVTENPTNNNSFSNTAYITLGLFVGLIVIMVIMIRYSSIQINDDLDMPLPKPTSETPSENPNDSNVNTPLINLEEKQLDVTEINNTVKPIESETEPPLTLNPDVVKKTKQQLVLEYLLSPVGKQFGISRKQAEKFFKTKSLKKIIFNLRKKGHSFTVTKRHNETFYYYELKINLNQTDTEQPALDLPHTQKHADGGTVIG